ncbi:MAG: hypothetical protein HC846_13975 [Blastocatellia bacterium]|nr:hypothetical protein [Blastocatellia bacterium]
MILNPFLLERAYNETRQLVRRETREKMRKRRYNALRKAIKDSSKIRISITKTAKC